MFALVDCNNFYASCERVFRPDLRGRPVVVLSNNDGCIIARSNEAKALGIEMGQPFFESEHFLREKEVEVFSSNYALYGDMSRRVMNILGRFTPRLEIYSIDEAFLDLSGFSRRALSAYADRIRREVVKSTGIPVSVGIGATKTLAKAASHFAKRNADCRGTLVIEGPEEREFYLGKLPVGDIWGIGRQYGRKLRRYNVRNAGDFARLPGGWVKREMTVTGLRVQRELRGEPCIQLEEVPGAKKAICTSRSFGTMQTRLQNIEEAVATFAHNCAAKLRSQHSRADTVIVFIHTNAFRERDPQYARNRVLKLPVPSNSSMEIVSYALAGLRSIYREGYRYKKAGVITAGIVPEGQTQRSLFDNVDREKHSKVMDAFDSVNDRYGRETIKIGAQGSGGEWKLRQERLSPRYTTSWRDIITVKV